MQELIGRVANELEVAEEIAGQAVGIVLNLVQQEADPADVTALFEKLPGAAALAESAPGSGGGVLGGLAASGLFGSKSGLMAGMAQLQGIGVSLEQAREMLPLVADFAREEAGTELVERIIDAIPGLGNYT